ncbi:response regulator transcription factor [Streptomyces sp. NBC_01450]|uniref:winged helix-turn-helix domain-containing protein n=1 Tax=Streptomyces sp. NBC_01450 TaxID=2903871 RepID=UPI002E31A6A5|nr:response regulator transcription factor [Streptomyces sp. NBC_01450]
MAPTSSGPNAPTGRGTYIVVPPSTQGRLRLLTVGPVELDLDGKQLSIAGTVMQIPLKEFLLLAALMDNAGRVLTRRQLLDTCWAPGHPDGTKTLDVHIKRVREHLAAADPALRTRLRTVRGLGGVFDVSPSPSNTPPATSTGSPNSDAAEPTDPGTAGRPASPNTR